MAHRKNMTRETGQDGTGPVADLVDPKEWAARTGRSLPSYVGAWAGLVTVPDDFDPTEPVWELCAPEKAAP